MGIIQKLWENWKKIGQMIGDFIGRMILTIIYFSIFVPFGLGVRIFSDPLELNPRLPASWVDRDQRDQNLNEARRLY